MESQPRSSGGENAPRLPPLLRGAGALGAGHVLSYLPGILAALAGVPLTLMLRGPALLSVTPQPSYLGDLFVRLFGISQLAAEQTRLVVEGALLLAFGVFVLVHVISLPWALAAFRSDGSVEAERRAARARTQFLVSTGVVTTLALGATVAGWLWVLLM